MSKQSEKEKIGFVFRKGDKGEFFKMQNALAIIFQVISPKSNKDILDTLSQILEKTGYSDGKIVKYDISREGDREKITILN